MAGNNTDKKGFSGFSDLVSDIHAVNEPTMPEPKAEAKPSVPIQQPQPQQETASFSFEPAQQSQNSPPATGTMNSGKSGGSSRGMWIFGILCALLVIWVISKSNDRPSYSPSPASQNYSSTPSRPSPAVTPPSTAQNSGQQYTKPSVGTNNMLSTPEIRWCVREQIRIEAMRGVSDTNAGIDAFNRLVNDYNSRCGSYSYRQGTLEQAKREVEQYRSQIVADAIREARQVGRPQQQSSVPSASSSPSANRPSEQSLPSSVPDTLTSQEIKEIQQILRDFGYDPGPADGAYGRRTADAVKALQRDAGIPQDGKINRALLDALRRVKAEYMRQTPR